MTAAHIAEMMDNFAEMEALARVANPVATDEQIFQMVRTAMNKSLGL